MAIKTAIKYLGRYISNSYGIFMLKSRHKPFETIKTNLLKIMDLTLFGFTQWLALLNGYLMSLTMQCYEILSNANIAII